MREFNKQIDELDIDFAIRTFCYFEAGGIGWALGAFVAGNYFNLLRYTLANFCTMCIAIFMFWGIDTWLGNIRPHAKGD